MTEKEKMLAGQLYDPSDSELTELRLKARKLARRYNLTDEDESEKQCEILKELLPNTQEIPGLQAPIYFDYGCNTIATPMHPLLPKERNCRVREDDSLYNLEYAKPITIENDCWLASNVVVCGGVTIGEGFVIGAGSVVTRDIPPHSLAVGNPCRVIREITEKDRME